MVLRAVFVKIPIKRRIIRIEDIPPVIDEYYRYSLKRRPTFAEKKSHLRINLAIAWDSFIEQFAEKICYFYIMELILKSFDFNYFRENSKII